METGSIAYNMYDKCYFDDILINIGKTINSFSGALNTAAKSGVYAMNLLNTAGTNNALVNMYDITIATQVAPGGSAQSSVQLFGTQIGIIIT
jgi:hypothetical protein